MVNNSETSCEDVIKIDILQITFQNTVSQGVTIQLLLSRFILGSTEEHTVGVSTSCCYPGVRLEVRDLAGNTRLCEVGEVMAAGERLRSELGILFALSLWCLRQCDETRI